MVSDNHRIDDVKSFDEVETLNNSFEIFIIVRAVFRDSGGFRENIIIIIIKTTIVTNMR